MVYIDGAYDSKDYGVINHFEMPQYRPMVIGHNKKKTPMPSLKLLVLDLINPCCFFI